MSAERKISAFDLDCTLLKVTSSFAFAKFLYAQRYFSFAKIASVVFFTVSHKLGFLSIEEVHQRAFQNFFFGANAIQIRQFAEQFVTLSVDELIYQPAIAKLKEAQRAGEQVAILSSSPDFLVEPIAKRLGVSHCLATQYAVDKDGCFCHISVIVQGRQKANYLDEWRCTSGCAKEQVTAYSDSFHDLEFLQAAGTAVGVNVDRKLKAHCHAHGWAMI